MGLSVGSFASRGKFKAFLTVPLTDDGVIGFHWMNKMKYNINK